MRITVVVAGATLVTAAFAQSPEALRSVVSEINGREVIADGFIGIGLMETETYAFKDIDGNYYNVIFDAGRAARKQLEGCEFALFGGTPCKSTVKAEISVRGALIELIVYEVISSDPPAAEP